MNHQDSCIGRALPVTVSMCFRKSKGTKLIPMKYCPVIRTGMMYQRGQSANRQASVVQRDIKKQADPLSKDGLIGAFNRTYTVTQAIDKFIPEVYRHSRAIPGRYDYIPADSAAGVVVYDDLFVYSHHATDPCCGKLMNAFDVVRLHKFGDKDARAAEGTEPGKLPIFQGHAGFCFCR